MAAILQHLQLWSPLVPLNCKREGLRVLSPAKLTEQVLNRLTEIIWWNWGLTRLHNPDLYRNHEQFFRGRLAEPNRLLEVGGPFVERVEPSRPHQQSWDEFAQIHQLETEVTQAVRSVLFKNHGDLPLYLHQGKTAALAMGGSPRDVILSVPTSMGKTESFLIPVLNHCVQENKQRNRRLKAIVMYPMKTLESDQLARLLRYLQALNSYLPAAQAVTVGIWDGDTPDRLAYRRNDARGIQPGTPVRGLTCPHPGHEGSRLVINRQGHLECEHGCRLPYVKTVRSDIRTGVDILITNPTALEFALLSNNADQVQRLFGANPEDRSVRYICIDEAHVYDGYEGAVFSLFLERLKHFYAKADPRFILVSATLGNPKGLAERLLRSTRVEAVEFAGKAPDIPPGAATGLELLPCAPDVLFAALWSLCQGEDPAGLGRETDPALGNLQRLGLIRPAGEGWEVTPNGKALADLFNAPGGPIAALDDERRVAWLAATAETIPFQRAWLEVLREGAPAVLGLLTRYPEKFIHYDRLVADLALVLPTGTDLHAQLNTMLSWVRLAAAYLDKHHLFLRPPHGVYWCPKCRWLNNHSRCAKCDGPAYQLSFCKCHQPLLELSAKEGPEFAGGEVPADVAAFLERGPLLVEPGQALKEATALYQPATNQRPCPTCGRLLPKDDLPHPVHVHYRSLTTYLTATLAERVPSAKVLAFADSRATVERIATDLIEQEYALAAERMAAQILRRSGGSLGWHDLQSQLLDQFMTTFHKTPYREILRETRDADLDSDTKRAKDLLRDMEDRVRNKALLVRTVHLFLPAVMGPACLHAPDSGLTPVERAVGQAIFTRLLATPAFTFRKHKFEHMGLPARLSGASLGLMERVRRDLRGLAPAEVDNCLDRVLDRLVSAGVVIEQPLDVVTEEVRKGFPDDVEAMLKQLGAAEGHSRVFNVRVSRVDWPLQLINDVTRCHQCLKVACGRHERCVYCGHGVTAGVRSDNGYLDEPRLPFAADHWARETLGYADGSEAYVPRIVTAVHRAGLPVSMRSAHEEGFRRGRINIIAATPTMELGINIGSLDCMVQVGIAPRLANYLQRAGRTGRGGNAALVWTVIRNGHAVDNHFFADLDRRFLNAGLTPNRIPDYAEMDAALAGQLLAEVCVYLCRHDRNGYDRIYNPLGRSAGDAVRLLMSATRQFRYLVLQRRAELESHLQQAFSSASPSVILGLFERIFIDHIGHVSLQRRTREALARLQSMVVSEDERQEFCQERFSVFPLWLSHLDLLGGGSSEGAFPVARPDNNRREVEIKSGTQILREAFPGEANGPGAIFSVASNRYVVTDVLLEAEQLARVHVCMNSDCDLPFKVYPTSLAICPFCRSPLSPVPVHAIRSVKCALAEGLSIPVRAETVALTDTFGGDSA